MPSKRKRKVTADNMMTANQIRKKYKLPVMKGEISVNKARKRSGLPPVALDKWEDNGGAVGTPYSRTPPDFIISSPNPLTRAETERIKTAWKNKYGAEIVGHGFKDKVNYWMVGLGGASLAAVGVGALVLTGPIGLAVLAAGAIGAGYVGREVVDWMD